MFIFIDEAGTFAPTTDHVISTMVAVIVPENFAATLFRRFRKLTRDWRSSKGEVKASSLDEKQVAAVLALLRRFDIIAFVVTIDTGTHTLAAVAADKEAQAAAVERAITASMHPDLQSWLKRCADGLQRMPPQLYLQFVAMREVVADVLSYATLYYAQRIPSTLRQFVWRIDAKDRSVTTAEATWRDIVQSLLQSRSREQPQLMADMEEADYSAMERFRLSQPRVPDHLRRSDDKPDEAFHAMDLNLVLGENLRFLRSELSTGLQIADLVATAFRKACNGKLRAGGWGTIGRILVQQGDPRAAAFRRIQVGEPREPDAPSPAANVARRIRGEQKSILVARVFKP